ncbi:MAG: hypothetical protein HYT12_03570 [Candidatus Liptonbacteria bacterium]|nr:hypothetical protein [Candidatus Liptonbacteria bacterium]
MAMDFSDIILNIVFRFIIEPIIWIISFVRKFIKAVFSKIYRWAVLLVAAIIWAYFMGWIFS